MTTTQHRRKLQSLGRARRRFREEAPQAIREARADGLTVQEIADLLRITRKAVYDLREKR